jgi:hypothetical protein
MACGRSGVAALSARMGVEVGRPDGTLREALPRCVPEGGRPSEAISWARPRACPLRAKGGGARFGFSLDVQLNEIGLPLANVDKHLLGCDLKKQMYTIRACLQLVNSWAS